MDQKPKWTPPRSTVRTDPNGPRPADQIVCPGCGVMHSRSLIGCPSCWRRVPGELKAKLAATTAGTIGRARVVGEMRTWLKSNPPRPGAPDES
jgi:hypothetical protein